MPGTFPPVLRAAQQRSGLTLKQIADKAKVPLATVSAMMTGKRRPRIETLEPLAQALGLTADETIDFILAALSDRPGAPLVATIASLRQNRRRH